LSIPCQGLGSKAINPFKVADPTTVRIQNFQWETRDVMQVTRW
jgi:hypothetical protein